VIVRLTALLLAAALCAVGLLWLHTQVMPYHGWAARGADWTITATGWATLLYAWPVELAGLIAGGWAGLLVGGWLGNRAAQIDLANQHQAAQQAQDLARASEKSARETQARAAQAQSAATLAEAQAKQAQARAEAHSAAAEARIAEITAHAQATIAVAEARRRNAAGAAERRRRKLERLQSSTPKV
jgi:hypothetical protein